jgi:hypothetical protein
LAGVALAREGSEGEVISPRGFCQAAIVLISYREIVGARLINVADFPELKDAQPHF